MLQLEKLAIRVEETQHRNGHAMLPQHAENTLIFVQRGQPAAGTFQRQFARRINTDAFPLIGIPVSNAGIE